MDISTEDFFEYFANPTAIRVSVDWWKVRQLKIPVKTRLADGWTELSKGYFPWYVSPGQQEAIFSDAGSTPIALADVAKLEPVLSPERRDKIREIRHWLMQGGPAFEIIIPAYELDAGRRLYLDGCHRLAAAAGLSSRIRAVLLSLDGPIDPNIIPDLAHWRPECRS